MAEKIWACKIGGNLTKDLPRGSDLPMRIAIGKAYRELTGEDPEFIFSGWAGELDQYERAVAYPEEETPRAREEQA